MILGVPLYVAVIVRFPLGKPLVVRLAFFELSATVPRIVLPFLNVTVPLTAEDVGLDTLAVKVTAWPRADGFSEDLMAVVLVA